MTHQDDIAVARRIPVRGDIELRLLHSTDGAALSSVVAAHLDALTRWLPHLAPLATHPGARRFILDKEREWADGHGAEWGVWEGAGLVGAAWLTDLDEHNGSADVGYWLAPPARGRGLATECCRAILRHAFHDLGLHRISIRCIADNAASRAIPERLGFCEEATIREAWKVHGQHVDHVVYRLLDREWRSAAG